MADVEEGVPDAARVVEESASSDGSHSMYVDETVDPEVQTYKKKIPVANVLVNLAYILNWSNLTVLQGLYTFLSIALGVSIAELGILSTLRTCAMFASMPLWGFVADKWISRRWLLFWSVEVWSALTAVHIFARGVGDLAALCILTGIAMGAVTPCTRSLVAHYYAIDVRSRYYGYFEVGAGIGAMLGAVLGSLIGGIDYPDSTFGTDYWRGWQVVFLALALVTAPFGFLMLYFVVDPLKDPGPQTLKDRQLIKAFPGLAGGESVVHFSDLKEIASCHMWKLIVVQGIFGSMPWTGLGYLIIWFQLMGLTDLRGTLLFASLAIGASVGGGIGGFFGDRAYKYSVKYGRIFIAHISVFAGVPMAVVFLRGVDPCFHNGAAFAVLGVVTGLLISWPPPCNCVNETDVIRPSLHSSAISLQYCIEGIFGSFGSALVGAVIALFGKGDVAGVIPLNLRISDPKFVICKTDPGNWMCDVCEAADRGLAEALEIYDVLIVMGNSMMIICMVGWAISCVFYFPMYYYYPRESWTINGKSHRAEEEASECGEGEGKKQKRVDVQPVTTYMESEDSAEMEMVTFEVPNAPPTGSTAS